MRNLGISSSRVTQNLRDGRVRLSEAPERINIGMPMACDSKGLTHCATLTPAYGAYLTATGARAAEEAPMGTPPRDRLSMTQTVEIGLIAIRAPLQVAESPNTTTPYVSTDCPRYGVRELIASSCLRHHLPLSSQAKAAGRGAYLRLQTRYVGSSTSGENSAHEARVPLPPGPVKQPLRSTIGISGSLHRPPTRTLSRRSLFLSPLPSESQQGSFHREVL